MISKQHLTSAISISFIGLIIYFNKLFPINQSASETEDEILSKHRKDANKDDNFQKANYSSLQIKLPIVNRVHPNVTEHDLIYNSKRNTVPIVNEEYNIIFFQVAKVASSEWSRFFMRLNNDPRWCTNECIHDPEVSGLKHLTDYSIEEAEEMMTSPEWTKAVFVRHPKPRILSAFLDKAVLKSDHFMNVTCRKYEAQNKSYDECATLHQNFDFFVNEITTTLSGNVHWRSIHSRIDEKWWPYINVIGKMENLSNDAKSLLKYIHSNKTGISAWDKIGTSGWSDNERDCVNTIKSKGQFLAQRDVIHTTSARDKMLKYYTVELEQFVEKRYADDLNNPYFHIEPMKLF
jgi:hypothetical protein